MQVTSAGSAVTATAVDADDVTAVAADDAVADTAGAGATAAAGAADTADAVTARSGPEKRHIEDVAPVITHGCWNTCHVASGWNNDIKASAADVIIAKFFHDRHKALLPVGA